jgi:hypothetical protein
VALLLQLISFHIIMLMKRIIALWASYLFIEPVFHTIFLPALWEAQGRDFNAGLKCLIQV